MHALQLQEHQIDRSCDDDLDVAAEQDRAGRVPAAPLNLQDDPARAKEIGARGVRGSGRPVPHADAIEEATGRSTEGIEAFVGGEAAEACDALGAEGYALGNKVAFKEEPDAKLAGHEAEHVFQQAEGASVPDGVGQAGDAFEQKADAVGEVVASGGQSADARDIATQKAKGDGEGEEVVDEASLQKSPAQGEALQLSPQAPATGGGGAPSLSFLGKSIKLPNALKPGKRKIPLNKQIGGMNISHITLNVGPNLQIQGGEAVMRAPLRLGQSFNANFNVKINNKGEISAVAKNALVRLTKNITARLNITVTQSGIHAAGTLNMSANMPLMGPFFVQKGRASIELETPFGGGGGYFNMQGGRVVGEVGGGRISLGNGAFKLNGNGLSVQTTVNVMTPVNVATFGGEMQEETGTVAPASGDGSVEKKEKSIYTGQDPNPDEPKGPLEVVLDKKTTATLNLVNSAFESLTGMLSAKVKRGGIPIVGGQFLGGYTRDEGLSGIGAMQIYTNFVKPIATKNGVLRVIVGDKKAGEKLKKKATKKPIKHSPFSVDFVTVENNTVKSFSGTVPFSIHGTRFLDPTTGDVAEAEPKEETLVTGSVTTAVDCSQPEGPSISSLIGTVSWHPDTEIIRREKLAINEMGQSSTKSLFTVSVGKKPAKAPKPGKKKASKPAPTSITLTILKDQMGSVQLDNVRFALTTPIGVLKPEETAAGDNNILEIMGTTSLTAGWPLHLNINAGARVKKNVVLKSTADGKKVTLKVGEITALVNYADGEFTGVVENVATDIEWPLAGSPLHARGVVRKIGAGTGGVEINADYKLTKPYLLNMGRTGAGGGATARGGQKGGDHLKFAKGSNLGLELSQGELRRATLSGASFQGKFKDQPFDGEVKEGGIIDGEPQVDATLNLKRGLSLPLNTKGGGKKKPLIKTGPLALGMKMVAGQLESLGLTSPTNVTVNVARNQVTGTLKKLGYEKGGFDFDFELTTGLKDLEWRNSPALKLVDGKIGGGFRNGEFTALTGSLIADVQTDGAKKQKLARAHIDVTEADLFEGKVSGSATLETAKDVELHKKVTLKSGAKGTVQVQDNKLKGIALQALELQVQALRPEGITVKADSMTLDNTDDGPRGELKGGSMKAIDLMKGKLKLGLQDVNMDTRGNFDAAVEGEAKPVPEAAVKFYGSLSSKDWIPNVGFSGLFSKQLMPPKTWLKIPKQGKLKKLVDVNVNMNVCGVPSSVGIELGTGMEVGTTGLTAEAFLSSGGMVELDPRMETLPDLSGELDLKGGVYAETSLEVKPKIGLGIENFLWAGLIVPMGITQRFDVKTEVSGEVEMVNGEFGGKLGLGLTGSAPLTLNVAPKLDLHFLKHSWPQPLGLSASYTFNDLLSFDEKLELPFGTLHGDREAAEGAPLISESGPASQELQQLEENQAQTEPVTELEDGAEMPGSEQGGGLMKDLKHIQSTAEIVGGCLNVINPIPKALGLSIEDFKSLPDPLTLPSLVKLLGKVQPDLDELTDVFKDFYEVCERAEKEGTLEWLEEKLPKGFDKLPKIVGLYLKSVGAGEWVIGKFGSFVGIESPADRKKRIKAEIATINQRAKILDQAKFKLLMTGLGAGMATDLANHFARSQTAPSVVERAIHNTNYTAGLAQVMPKLESAHAALAPIRERFDSLKLAPGSKLESVKNIVLQYREHHFLDPRENFSPNMKNPNPSEKPPAHVLNKNADKMELPLIEIEKELQGSS